MRQVSEANHENTDTTRLLQEQLLQALSQLQELSARVEELEARQAEQQRPAAHCTSTASRLQNHQRLVLPNSNAQDQLANGSSSQTAAQRLLGTASTEARPPLASPVHPVPRPVFEAEVPMAATRIVMTQIVSPAESNGLDVCMVSC
jgi:hypothetical protein